MYTSDVESIQQVEWGYYDVSIFYTTYFDMCRTNTLQVDAIETIRLFERCHVVLEHTNNYVGSC